MPWGQMPNPVRAIQDLAREHDVPSPGYLRPEITLYRFRAYELVERSGQGPVDIFNPSRRHRTRCNLARAGRVPPRCGHSFHLA